MCTLCSLSVLAITALLTGVRGRSGIVAIADSGLSISNRLSVNICSFCRTCVWLSVPLPVDMALNINNTAAILLFVEL